MTENKKKYTEAEWEALIEEYVKQAQMVCNCAGYTCSGCEPITRKTIEYTGKFLRKNLDKLPEVQVLLDALEICAVPYVTSSNECTKEELYKSTLNDIDVAKQALAEFNKLREGK